MSVDGEPPASSRSTTSAPRRAASRASRPGRRSCRSGRRRRRWFLKAESLQPIGAFKIRGAYNAVASLPPDERARGVITYSSGNHAQGVARAARLLGAPAVVVMPSDAPAIKRERVAADGAEIVVVGTASDERQAVAERHRRGARPRDHPAVRRRPDHRRPGHDRARDRRGRCRTSPRSSSRSAAAGSASGVATAVRALAPGARADRRRAGARRRRAGIAREPAEIVRWPAELVSRTIADGTRTPGARPADVRPPLGAARRDRHGHRGRDRRRGPARRRGEPARRRAVGRAERRRARVPGASEAGLAEPRRPDRRRRLRRQRRPGALPGLPRRPDPGRLEPRLARPWRCSCWSASRSASDDLAGPDRDLARSSARRSARAASRSSNRIQPATIAMTAAMKRKSPASHITAPASCWSTSGDGTPRPVQRRVVRIERRAREQDHDREERVLGHLQEDVHRPGPDGASATAPGRGPTAGHQNSSAVTRNRTCSRSWSHGFSSAASKSGEKWVPHMTAANSSQATTGWDEPADRPRVEDRQEAAPPDVGPGDAQERASPARRQGDQRRRDEDQQEVLDHVDREQRRVVAGRSRTGARTRSRTARRGTPASATAARGWPGGPRSRAGPPRASATAEPTSGSRISGSNDQPNRMLATVGGSAGTGPWASTAAGRRARRRARRRPPRRPPRRPRRRPRPTGDEAWRDGPSSDHRRTLAGIGPRARSRSALGAALGLEWSASGRAFGPWPSAEPSVLSRRRPPACRRRRHEIEEVHVEPPGSEALVRNDPDRARRCRRRRARRHLGRPERPGHRPELLPAGSGDDARARRSTISTTIVFVIAVAIFFVVEGLIVWTVLRYRRKPGDDELPPQTHGNNLAEVVWTVVPTLIVIFLFFISWQTLNTVEAKSNAARPPGPGRRRPVPVDVRLPGAGRARRPTTRCSRCRRRSRPDGGLYAAGRQDDPPLPDEQRRHPRVLRPGVPLQARRRPGPSSTSST